MAQKKKTFSKVKAIKDAARVNIGAPKSTRAIPDAKKKAELRGEKHKKGLEEVLEEDAPEEDRGVGGLFRAAVAARSESKKKNRRRFSPENVCAGLSCLPLADGRT